MQPDTVSIVIAWQNNSSLVMASAFDSLQMSPVSSAILSHQLVAVMKVGAVIQPLKLCIARLGGSCYWCTS